MTKKIIPFLIYLPAAFLFGLLRILPRGAVRAMGRALGRLTYTFDRSHRSLAEANLKTAFGETLNKEEISKIVRRAFIHFGISFFDLFHLAWLPPQKRAPFLQIKGGEHLRKAAESGKGVLIYTAHFGLWEIAQALINPIVPMHVVARPLDNPFLERQLLRLRARLGSKVISKFSAGRGILRALNDNQAVGILIDQNVQIHEAVFVDFFSEPAATTPSLALFHIRTGAPLIPLFCLPTPAKTYCLEILPPTQVELTGDRQTDTIRVTQSCTRVIEDQIRRAPEYWFWFHNRWKTRPPADNG
jgi:KDO2-lipid IV(A) lauroyltransferase